MASTVIYRDSVSTGHNKFTFSAWVKRSAIATSKTILGMYNNNDQRGKVRFGYSTDNKLYVWLKNAVGTEFNWYSNREFRDCNGYYHIVVTIDTTQATASNRCKVYVNGEQLTGNTSGQDIVQNSTTMIFGHSKHSIGNSYYNGSWESQYFDGIMSHVHCCYGYAYQGSDFGETDSTTGEWKIKTSPSVSYGTNGHFILKDGNSTTDQSGNSISLTTNGTLTKTEDCPSNVFATLNPLDKGKTGTMNFANGNTTTMNTSGFGDYGVRSTLGVNSGKFYWEIKIGSNTSQNAFAIQPMDVNLKFDMFGSTPEPHLYGLQQQTTSATNFYNNTTFTSGNTAWGGGLTSSDVVGFALDMDNGKLYISKNGAFKDMSGNTSNLSSGTYPTFTISDTSKTYGLYVEMRTNDDNGTKVNFGNGYFGTTAVSNAGTNASGIGIFEYDVPTGYTALSTKGLNE